MVGATATLEGVAAGVTEDVVRPVAADDPVVAVSGEDRVVAAEAEDRVLSLLAVDRVGAVGDAVQRIDVVVVVGSKDAGHGMSSGRSFAGASPAPSFAP